MSMPILALFHRTLREDSRRLMTYLGRLTLVGVILVTLISLIRGWSRLGAPGLEFFKFVIYVNCAFVTLAGLSYFPAVIAEEKEQMTLGLLRMTSLSPVAILLGKSTSRMITVTMLLLAQFPFTLLAVTLGGVSVNQVIAAYCTLLAYIVFLSNVALFWSVVSKRSGTAGGLTVAFLLGFFLIPSIGPGILNEMAGAGWVMKSGLVFRSLGKLFEWMWNASPFTRIGAIMTTGFSASPVGFQVLVNLGVGLFFFLLSWATFDLFTRQQKEPAPSRGLLVKRTSRLRRLGSGRAWRCALIWKNFHFTSGGILAIMVKLLFYALLIGGIAYVAGPLQDNRLDREDVGAMTMIIMLFVLGLELALLCSRVFGSEMRLRSVPNISLLPLSPTALAYRKILGCSLALIPALVYFLVGALLAPDSFTDAVDEFFSVPEGVWGSLSGLLFFLHLTVYLSLVVRRGALALAFGICFIGSYLMFALFALAAWALGIDLGVWVVWPLAILMSGLTVLLHFRIGSRLVKVAGQ